MFGLGEAVGERGLNVTAWDIRAHASRRHEHRALGLPPIHTSTQDDGASGATVRAWGRHSSGRRTVHRDPVYVLLSDVTPVSPAIKTFS